MRLAAALGLIAVATGALSAAAAAGSPATRLQTAIAKGDRQKSVHYTSSWTTGKTTVSMVGDAGRTAGIQRITFTKDGTTGHVTVLVVADDAYIRGDAFTLANYIGFTAAAAKKAAGSWLVLAHGAPGFASVAAGVRLSSALQQLELTAPVTTTKAAHGSVGFHGTHDFSGSRVGETVYVQTGGAKLPLSAEIGGSAPAHLAFSHWDERLHLAAPTVPVTAGGGGGTLA